MKKFPSVIGITGSIIGAILLVVSFVLGKLLWFIAGTFVVLTAILVYVFFNIWDKKMAFAPKVPVTAVMSILYVALAAYAVFIVVGDNKAGSMDPMINGMDPYMNGMPADGMEGGEMDNALNGADEGGAENGESLEGDENGESLPADGEGSEGLTESLENGESNGESLEGGNPEGTSEGESGEGSETASGEGETSKESESSSSSGGSNSSSSSGSVNSSSINNSGITSNAAASTPIVTESKAMAIPIK